MKQTHSLVGILVLLGSATSVARGEDKPSPQSLEFFEKKVRPLLVKNCYECHGPEKQKGGLRLDWREGWAKGGDSGPAIVPGKPEESLLIEAVNYASYEMPPTGKLPADQIALLQRWVKMGAPDPRTTAPSGVAGAASNLEEGRKHWAYQPPARHEPPAVEQADWPQGRVDRFILAALEAEGLNPVADADPQTLVRRVYFDLTGLPPTPEQIDAFTQAAGRDLKVALESLVDELLASPRFGERWGRHWLDVARFGESVTLRGFVFPQAWRYRDYVIDAFNRDLPYDQFVAEQIAGDLLPADDWQTQQRQMVATTFLMLGNTNFEEQDKKQLDMDVVDEQLDTIGKAFLAQTIGCARCHDHKFDPIPTRDYYALAGIMRSATALEHSNVSKWIERALPLPPDQAQQFEKHEAALAALRAEIKEAKDRAAKLAEAASKATVETPAVLAASDLPGLVIDSSQAKVVGEWQLSQYSKRYIGDGYLHDKNEGKGAKSLTFQSDQLKPGRYEVRLAYSPGTSRATNVPITVLHAAGESEVEVNQQQTPPIDARFVSLGQFRFEQNQGYVLVSNEGTKGHVTVDAVQFLPLDAEGAVIADARGGKNGAEKDKADNASATLESAAAKKQSDDLAREIRRMEAELKKLTESGPQRPMAMTLREEGKFADIPIHIRGSVHNLGPVAPRGFLQVATRGQPPAISQSESGRRQLAEWLASSENPLTARVMVNRVWHWVFGSGLVRTNDNFGTTGDMPSHPELLDDLTVRFIEQGWSVKRLIRELMLSHTYRLASTPDPKCVKADPENRLLWRMNRRRLEAEALRDAMLSASGQLQHLSGGPTFKAGLASDYGYKHTETCRSVYLPLFRNALPDIFEAFDYPDPSMVTGRRNTSTVAPQALFFMNHPFAMEQARLTAERVLGDKEKPATSLDDDARLERLYRIVLGRLPSSEEQRIALAYVQAGKPSDASKKETPDASLAAWSAIVQSLFASPDFRYLE